MPAKVKHIKLRKYMNPDSPITKIATGSDSMVSLEEEARAADVLSVMLNKGIRRVPIVEKGTKKFRGIISTTDMVNFLGGGPRYDTFKKSKVGLDVPASDIMVKHVYTIDTRNSISDAINLIRKENVGGLPMLNRGKLVGFVSESDVVSLIRGSLGMRVKDIMMRKPFFVRETYRVFDVARMMVHGPYRRLPVVKDGILTGVVTPFDVLKYLNKGRKLRGLRDDRSPVRKVMNPNCIYTKANSRLHDAIKIMMKHRVGGLPVVEGEEMDITGIVSERDVIDFLV